MAGYRDFGYWGVFPGGPSPSPPGGPYFGPGYWGPDYFGPGYWGTAAAVAPPTPGDDHDIIEDVIARLIATGIFDVEAVVGYEAQGPAPADWVAMVRVTPGDAVNLDDFLPYTLIRQGSYTLQIEARDADIAARDRMLVRATATAINALSGVNLAGITAPDMTRLRSDGRPVIKGPAATATMKGQWAFVSPGYAGLTISD